MLLTLSVMGLLALLGLTAYWWSALPGTIPTHFDAAGQPNAYGPRASILFLPGLALGLTTLFTVVAQYPWTFNYPVIITAENAERNYVRGRRLLAALNALMVCAFTVIQWQIIALARGVTPSVGPLSGPTLLVASSLAIPAVALLYIVWWLARGRTG
jgi:uncharacterized membrane protein